MQWLMRSQGLFLSIVCGVGFLGCATPAMLTGQGAGDDRSGPDLAGVGTGVGGAADDMAMVGVTPPDDVVDMARAKAPQDLAQNTQPPPAPIDMAQQPPPPPPPSCSAAEHVVINELKIGGTSALGDEFIELYNPCAQDVTVTNWTLSHFSQKGTSETSITKLTFATIAGHGYALISSAACGCKTSADQTYANAAFSADGGGLGLRDASGTLVDAVGFGTGAANAFVEDQPAAAPDAGKSIARHPNGTDSNHNQNDFAIATTPSPRAKNP